MIENVQVFRLMPSTCEVPISAAGALDGAAVTPSAGRARESNSRASVAPHRRVGTRPSGLSSGRRRPTPSRRRRASGGEAAAAATWDRGGGGDRRRRASSAHKGRAAAAPAPQSGPPPWSRRALAG
ncbi:t101 [Tupaiid betaherpesvirus 1]|uniref:T101 n=1 Tax=Tupaiid herpesvirus 1 (strain 1) TaxID=10397 RepID=Q91TK3_TUHV1|nr:t101 [Tupaiid betaherpesvirus 1]AAK57144.1 t101 [Tupaiid betaherpesvirus 1]